MATTRRDSWQESATEREKNKKLNPLYMMLTAAGMTVGAVGEAVLGPQNHVEPVATSGEDHPEAGQNGGDGMAQNSKHEQEEPTVQQTDTTPDEEIAKTQEQPENPEGWVEQVDEEAEKIASAVEIDDDDIDFVSMMTVEGFATREDEFGNEVHGANVVLANGNHLFLADKDGDGEYDSMYTTDGYLAQMEFDGHVLSPDEIGYHLAVAHISRSDLEENISQGAYMAQNEHDEQLNAGEVPEEDIIDPDAPAHTSGQETALNEEPADVGGDNEENEISDEELEAILAVLAVEADDVTVGGNGQTGEDGEDDDPLHAGDDEDVEDIDIDIVAAELLAERNRTNYIDDDLYDNAGDDNLDDDESGEDLSGDLSMM